MTLVLMGVSGVGKTKVMDGLAGRARTAFAEGDAFHPDANIEKMHAGTPLTDDDRWPWLRAVADWIGAREREGIDAVVTCSALRRSYRDLLRDGHPSVVFVHLTAPRDVLEKRLAARKDHYMPASLLDSQLETLEPLEPDEPGLELSAERRPDDLAGELRDRLDTRAFERTEDRPRP